MSYKTLALKRLEEMAKNSKQRENMAEKESLSSVGTNRRSIRKLAEYTTIQGYTNGILLAIEELKIIKEEL